MGRCVVICFLLIAAGASLHAMSQMVAEVYPLDLLDPEASEEVAKAIASSEAKVVADKEGHRLIVFDFPEKHQEIKRALAKMKPPTDHVRIRVTFKEAQDRASDDVGVRIGVKPEDAGSRGNAPLGQITVEQTAESLRSTVSQELLVLSGARGRIRIGTDVPNAEWIWSYGSKEGWWTGSTQWKQVGASLLVEAYVMSDKRIRVRLTPEFSYLVDDQSLTTAVETLTTEVIVKGGEVVDLGGIPVSHQDFYSKFLVGYDRQGERRSLHILLLPTLEPM